MWKLFTLYFVDLFRTRDSLAKEILCLRQQLLILKRKKRRVVTRPADRLFWLFISRIWRHWRNALIIVKPETVIRWQRNRAKRHWWSITGTPPLGRKPVSEEIIQLIERLAYENILWGAPRIHGELLKLGYKVSERTVSRYLPKDRGNPRDGNWLKFLKNNHETIFSVDFFSTFTTDLRQIRTLLVFSHDRRKILHFGVTQASNVSWLRNQLVGVFPGICPYKILIADHEDLFVSKNFKRIISEDLNIKVVNTAKRRPWQNGHIERCIGSVKRELLDHVIVKDEAHLHRLLAEYKDYYNKERTHYSLHKQTPIHSCRWFKSRRRLKRRQHLGGLHSSYQWVA